MSRLVWKAEVPEKRAGVGKCWDYGVAGEGYQPQLGPEEKFPAGGVLSSVSRGASVSQPCGKGDKGIPCRGNRKANT